MNLNVRTTLALAVAVSFPAMAAPAASAQIVAEPSAHAFPATPLKASNVAEIWFRNTGDFDPFLDATTITGSQAAAFAVSWDECSGWFLDPDESCLVRVRFTPSSVGAHSATLELESEDPDSPHTVALSGEGLPEPKVELWADPASIDFGVTWPGLPVTREVVVENRGGLASSALEISEDDPGKNFTVSSGTCGKGSVAPGASCRFSISFVARDSDPLGATVRVQERTGSVALALPVTGRSFDLQPDADLIGGFVDRATARWRSTARRTLADKGFSIKSFTPRVEGEASLVLRVLRRGRSYPLASASAYVAGPVTLVARPGTRGKRLLAERRPLRLKATLEFTTERGQSATVTRTFRLAARGARKSQSR